MEINFENYTTHTNENEIPTHEKTLKFQLVPSRSLNTGLTENSFAFSNPFCKVGILPNSPSENFVKPLVSHIAEILLVKTYVIVSSRQTVYTPQERGVQYLCCAGRI